MSCSAGLWVRAFAFGLPGHKGLASCLPVEMAGVKTMT
jgi:hypothetical protein